MKEGAAEFQSLGRKHEAIARFQSGLAHDLNNRLTTILGNLILLEDLLPDAGEMLSDLHVAAEEACNLVRLVQTFTRQDVLPSHAVNVGDTLGRLHDLIARLHGDRHSVSCLPPEAPVWIDADEGALEQIVMLLLAERAAEGGVVHVVRVEEEWERVRIHFEGVGGRGGELPEGLYRGMTTFRELLSEYGGWMEEGAGWIALVFPRSEAEVPPPASFPPRAKGRHVLLGEGCSLARACLADGLRRWGYEVVEAADTAQVIEEGGSGAVILDTTLGGGGAEVLRGWAGLPAERIWLTPYAMRHPALTGEANVLAKPVTAGDLHRVLSTLVSAD